MKQLYEHQERFLQRNPNRALLVWETGVGKTIAACEWLKLRPTRAATVVCPKSIVEKWERDLKEWGVTANVVSMSRLTEHTLQGGALVIDEAHHFASPLFTAQRSKRSTMIYNFVKSRPVDVLLLTATPIRSTPYNIHTLACYLGHYWNIKEFRQKFFTFTDKFGRWHWEPKKDWRVNIRPYVEKIADIVTMASCVDVPIQREQVIDIPWTHADEDCLVALSGYEEPSKEWHTRHRAENGQKKNEKIMELMDGYRKAIVVCNYTQQIDDLVRFIGEERQVYVLDGRTKNHDETIEMAKKSDDCIFIVQASMGAGFDAAEFDVVIFASMSFRYIDMVQMKGRVKRINDLHENLFIYLIGGKNDRRVYETIMAGKDFDVLEELKRRL